MEINHNSRLKARGSILTYIGTCSTLRSITATAAACVLSWVIETKILRRFPSKFGSVMVTIGCPNGLFTTWI